MNHIWQYLSDNHSQVLDWLRTTVWLSLVPLVVALVLSLPIGWLASRYRWTYAPVISLGGLLYTIPSIVLFLALPGVLGTGILDPLNVAVALTVYSVALLVRVVADGLRSVDATVLDAAAAMGYTERQRLLAVQLPMAVPVIGAGLRVAAVSNVSLIAVASSLGVSQLGSLFTLGATTSDTAPIWLGLILFVLLALVLDALILLGVRLATPWRRAVAR
ncbi:ABC transporter permease [Pseudofrankia inefficax]|uniref:Binding-protein-dependent transport systems inner membrane component n=1 Tax=Pseudofrankia inefficax (strain DSM 45817 / CECT 9037 / DDB 130130 / EuI1c) TaxID=298654 RepID=E3J3J1_PSEI1|nr:ABC transporter permease subunit [Pseudofrankia inefficax]ADP78193.1 binding-protein-dependent transport systems inner membrane component [Pseudofrankia inefficax]